MLTGNRKEMKQAIAAARAGVPAKMISDLSDSLQITKETLYQYLGIGGSTVERKAYLGERLNPWQSERVLGLEALVHVAWDHAPGAHNYDEVAQWLGDWLLTPHAALDGEIPIAMLDTVTGHHLLAGLLRSTR